MFRNLLANVGGGAVNANTVLTQYQPIQLANYLELVWNAPRSAARVWRLPPVQTPAAGGPVGRLFLSRQMARNPSDIFAHRAPVNPSAQGAPGVFWSHLVYAYMIESTGIVDIFRKVLQTWVSEETLPFPSIETQYWINATEGLFFKAPSPYFHSLASSLRPEPDGIRVNAYQRLLGMELGPASPVSGKGQPVRRPPVIANTDFTGLFERLLYEVWNGFVYRLPGAGPNAADFQAMVQLVREIRSMLLARRTNGTLLREEFEAVAMLSWLHLTVEYDTHIVNDLSAEATTSASRLARIASLVGLKPAPAADSFFQLADAMSTALIAIESGLVEAALLGGTPVLSDPAASPLATVMQTIITHWPAITGRSIKGPVSTIIAIPTANVLGANGTNQVVIPANVGQEIVVTRSVTASEDRPVVPYVPLSRRFVGTTK